MAAISEFDAAENFSFFPDARIRFTIPGLLARGILRAHGVYVRFCEGRAISIPLIIFPVATLPKTDDRETLARYEAPQALLQVTLAYSHNQQLDQYTGFVITVDRTVLRIGRIVASGSYLRILCSCQPIKEDLLYYRSKPFELLEREEFLRLLFGVLRYVAESYAS